MWWGPQHPSVGGGAELQGRGPRNPTVGRDPSVQGDGSESGPRGGSEGNCGSGVLRLASNMNFIGGEAHGGANGVVIGILWCSLQTMANI